MPAPLGPLPVSALTQRHLEHTHNLTLMKISREQNDILENICLKVGVPVGLDNTSSNIILVLIYLVSYVESCQILCTLQIEKG